VNNLEELRAYCLAKPGAKETFPFDQETLVFKVLNKMFALCNIHGQPLRVNLKCEPELAVLLRQKYAAIETGYHMNKRHWNTVSLDGSIANEIIRELIDRSYELVVKSLKKADREALAKS
jgi:predicted DNA-binding protein (MmcQ/YjbR family)